MGIRVHGLSSVSMELYQVSTCTENISLSYNLCDCRRKEEVNEVGRDVSQRQESGGWVEPHSAPRSAFLFLNMPVLG